MRKLASMHGLYGRCYFTVTRGDGQYTDSPRCFLWSEQGKEMEKAGEEEDDQSAATS
jgi:hypothetical protein